MDDAPGIDLDISEGLPGAHPRHERAATDGSVATDTGSLDLGGAGSSAGCGGGGSSSAGPRDETDS